jgi:methionyl-tRNA formyltransferase
VKQAAFDRGILPVLQPPRLDAPEVLADLQRLAPDILVVAAFGAILPPPVLAAARLGGVNLHASLLPRWRGAAPVQRAILAGDERTGVSIMKMAEGLDTGPYCLQRSIEVDDHTTLSLTAALAELGAEALAEALRAIEAGTCEWHEQDPALVTYADKIGAADVALAPSLSVLDAYRRIRASSPQAPARLCVAGTDVVVTGAVSAQERLEPGRVHVDRRRLAVGFADGALESTTLTPQGRAPMEGAAFARGARLGADARWGECRAR